MTPAAALPSKGGYKSAATAVQIPPKPAPTSPIHIPKDYHRSLGDLKVHQISLTLQRTGELIINQIKFGITSLAFLKGYPSSGCPLLAALQT